MRGWAGVMATLAAGLLPGGMDVVHARAPAAHVLEVADWREGFPPPCTLARVRGRSLVVSSALARAASRGGGPGVSLPEGPTRVEEASRIILVRTMDGCHVVLGKARLASPEAVAELLGADLGPLRWRAAPHQELSLAASGTRCVLERGRGHCLGRRASPDLGCPVRIHYYGVLPLFLETEPGLDAPPVHEVTAGAVRSGRFSGTGDEAVYRVHVPEPGTLLLEYRSDAGPGALELTVRDGAGRTHRAGMMRLRRAAVLTLQVRYLGTGPASYDIGFLFEPAGDGAAVRPPGGTLAPDGPAR